MQDASPEMLSIFASAIERPSVGERDVFLDAACGADADLRRRIDVLLRAHDMAGGFLRDCPGPNDLPETVDHHVGERPGDVIGVYKLLEPIGEGGFGVVFLAEQSTPVRRKVALKILKPGMDSRAVVARFEAERQALALMDHPHIARVFDGGTTASGRPYFVMEHVKGVTITEFCDQNHLTPRQRLGLFVQVCQAVQHAHQKGVIHRDLKPSNVLVSRHDTTPVVKVIDFGVAKAVGQVLTEKTLFTGVAQMIGTPLYMSPEQAGMSDLDVDTRSDVYSLGVLLYELLTGTTPIDKERFKTVGYDEIRRIIREEEPARPSTRLSTLGLVVSTVSTNRGTEPRRLSAALRGELDWIVMKALEKDRTRRYETANSFAADVRRYLADEPVQACPPSVGYRLRKFARRNRAPVLAAAVSLLALVAGVAGTTAGLIRAYAAEAEAVDEAKQKGEALKAEAAAVIEAKEQLFAALVSRARAERTSGRIGQQFEALNALRRAAGIRATPELRTEATAALVLPDIELARSWDGCPEGTVGIGFDAAFERYVRIDGQGGLTVCKVTDGREEVVVRLPAHGVPMFSYPFVSPDGKFVAYAHGRQAGGSYAGVRVWKLDGPAPTVLIDDPVAFHESAIAFHADGKQLAIGRPDGKLSVYDLATGRRPHLLALAAPPNRIDFHPTDHRLAVAGGPDVQLFDTDAGRELPKLRQPAGAGLTFSVAWHPDGRRLAVGGDRRVRVWDADAAVEVMPPWAEQTSYGVLVRFNHAGDRLMSTDWSGQTVLWEAATGRPLLTLPGYYGFQLSPDDRLLGYSTSGTTIQLWRLASGREFRTLRRRGAGPEDHGVRLAVHPDGRTVAVGDDSALVFFDLTTGEELGSARHPLLWAHAPLGFAPPSPDLDAGGQPTSTLPARPGRNKRIAISSANDTSGAHEGAVTAMVSASLTPITMPASSGASARPSPPSITAAKTTPIQA